MASPATKLPALTGLRFLAAGMIVVLHSRGCFGLPDAFFDRFPMIQGVSFFFLLSGFILCHVYRELDTLGEKLHFLLARVARIWPGHLLSLLLVWCFFSDSACPLSTLLLNATMLHAWVPRQEVFFSLNVVSWSISAEFAFYLLFPVLLPGWRRTWWWKLPLTLLPACLAIAYCNFSGLIHRPLRPGEVSAVGLLYAFPPSRLFEFALGMALFVLWERLGKRLPRGLNFATALELLALALVVLNIFYAGKIADRAARIPGVGRAGEVYLFHGGGCVLSFGLLILLMAEGRGWVGRLLGSRPLVLLGEASFSVYLLHPLLLRWCQTHPAALAVLPNWLACSCFWAALLGISFLNWAVVERPARALLLKLWPPSRELRTRTESHRRQGTDRLLCRPAPGEGAHSRAGGVGGTGSWLRAYSDR